jgi:hypothetical protein
MRGFPMTAARTAMLHSGCAHLIDNASFTLATYGASGSTGSCRTDDHQWSRKTTARHALTPARVGLYRPGREQYQEPVMAIRRSRVSAQTGDQFRDPAAPPARGWR